MLSLSFANAQDSSRLHQYKYHRDAGGAIILLHKMLPKYSFIVLFQYVVKCAGTLKPAKTICTVIWKIEPVPS